MHHGTQNEWFTMENPVKMDDLGVPPFVETSILGRLFRPIVWSKIFGTNVAPFQDPDGNA